jgi:hypothetical protein
LKLYTVVEIGAAQIPGVVAACRSGSSPAARRGETDAPPQGSFGRADLFRGRLDLVDGAAGSGALLRAVRMGNAEGLEGVPKMIRQQGKKKYKNKISNRKEKKVEKERTKK